MFYPPVEPLALPTLAALVQTPQMLVTDPDPSAESSALMPHSYGSQTGDTLMDGEETEYNGYEGISIISFSQPKN